MEELFNLSKITVVTKTAEVQGFFKEITGQKISISFENHFALFNLEDKTVPVFDASFLEDESIFEKLLLGENINHLACFVRMGISERARKRAEKVFLNFITFPFEYDDFKCLQKKISLCLKSKFFRQTLESFLPEQSSLMGYFSGISGKIQEVWAGIEKAAENDEPVLLLGETGTGKTTAAKLIHKLSQRKNREFHSVNISTVVDSLASSTFFGTENGAYTDAQQQKGLFKISDRGSLLLDEIGLASQKVQQILLNVLENNLIKSLGSDTPQKVDVRLIFATNADLDKMLKNGKFRPDLYYRISDNIIRLPSLRERKEDIPTIVTEYLNDTKKEISVAALNRLESYDWPGNIRELRQCLNRAVKNSNQMIIQEDNLDFGLFNF